MSNELTCPVCGSHNCDCSEKPTHMHRCLDCKYDGTEPIEWAAVRLCREQRAEIERFRDECVYLESDAALAYERSLVACWSEAFAGKTDESVALRGALQALVDATADFKAPKHNRTKLSKARVAAAIALLAEGEPQ